MDEIIKLPKNAGSSVSKEGAIGDFLWDLLGCDSFNPPSTYCVTDANCDSSKGERCKQGECVVDISHCAISGCDIGKECDEDTGKCEPVSDCVIDSDCDMIQFGERCFSGVCRVPPVCTGAFGQTAGCAPTWSCVGSKCIKADCTVVTDANKVTCCETPIAFGLNELQCCAFHDYPGCP